MSLNTTIFDISPNNTTILSYGDSICQGNFTPYGSRYSVRSKGIPAIVIDESDFKAALPNICNTQCTIESWVYIEGTTGSGMVMFVNNQAGDTYGPDGNIWGITVNAVSTGVYKLKFGWYAGVAMSVMSTDTLRVGEWNHVAVSIDSRTPADTTVWLSVNGAVVSYTHLDFTQQNFDYASANESIRARIKAGSAPRYWYFSNLRVTKNAILYTSNFTPSLTVEPVTNDTVLLTFNSNRYKDSSNNNIKIYPIESVSAIVPFSPFTYALGSGGSIYFNESQSNYLAIPTVNSPSIAFGTLDFSIEFWVYMNARNGGGTGEWQPLIGTYSSSGWYPTEADGWVIAADANQHKIKFCSNMNGRAYATPVLQTADNSYNGIALKEWTHIALTRQSGTLILYKNGEAVATGEFLDDMPLKDLYVGRFGTRYFNGYISDIRFGAGNIEYTSDFIPPTSPVTVASNTVLLVPGIHATLKDGFEKTNFYAKGDVVFDSGVKKFGPSSLTFNDGVLVYTNPGLQNSPTSSNIITPFTIDFWFKTNVNNDGYIFRCDTIGARVTTARKLSFVWPYFTINSTQAVDDDQWHHAAIVRDTAEFRFYLDGTKFGSVANTSTGISMKDPGDTLYDPTVLGSYDYNGTSSNYVGHIDSFRFTKAVRYAGNTYNVPTETDY